MILDAIGNTPLIQIGSIWVKCEFLNPSGSVKARLAKTLIEKAEATGLLKPGDTIVEATSGNTGNALSMVAAAKGYKMLVLIPTGFSEERNKISKAFGADLELIGDFHLSQAVEYAKQLGSKPGYYCPQQFDNPWNIEENRDWLGKEIIGQLPKGLKVDAIIQGVGTGGTLIGVGEALRKDHNPNIRLIAIEPAESTTIQTGEIGKHKIEGIADGFVPSLFEKHRKEISEVISIRSDDAIEAMKKLATDYGILVGPSSGANYLAAQQVLKNNPQIKQVLTFFCDRGEKYLSEYY